MGNDSSLLKAQSLRNAKLLEASARNNTKKLKDLIQQGADINCRDKCHETGLMWAVKNGCTAAAVLLLEHGADPNVQNKLGETALHYAVHMYNMSISNRYLQPNIIAHYCTPQDNNNIKSRFGIVCTLAQHDAINYNLIDSGGQNVLMKAVCLPNFELAIWLIKAGAPVNSRSSLRANNTMLHEAINTIQTALKRVTSLSPVVWEHLAALLLAAHQAGGHLDIPNARGDDVLTAMQELPLPEGVTICPPGADRPLPLKCNAARRVADCVPRKVYTGRLPPAVVATVDLHNPWVVDPEISSQPFRRQHVAISKRLV